MHNDICHRCNIFLKSQQSLLRYVSSLNYRLVFLYSDFIIMSEQLCLLKLFISHHFKCVIFEYIFSVTINVYSLTFLFRMQFCIHCKFVLFFSHYLLLM